MRFADIKFLVFKALQYVNIVGHKKISTKVEISKVGTTGFEPATTRPPDVCATGLRYVPNKFYYFIFQTSVPPLAGLRPEKFYYFISLKCVPP